MSGKTTLTVALFLCAAVSAGCEAAPAGENYGLELAGKDPYAGLPLFYSAFPQDYPKDAARPARPTSGWHRWQRMSPALWADFRDVKLVDVERRIYDFEEEGELAGLRIGRVVPPYSLELSDEHATTGKKSLRLTVTETRGDAPTTVYFAIEGDAQRRHTDNWRWIRLDVFNATGREVVVGFNKLEPMAREGFGPTFVLKPGANTLACKTAELDGYFYYRGPSGYGMSRFFLFLFAKPGDVLHFDNVRLVQEAGEALSKRGRLFDFGSAENQDPDKGGGGIFPGWTGVDDKTAWTKERGFGWQDDAGGRRSTTMFHRHTHALLNDWVSLFTPGAKFLVDLPNGNYRVWLLGNLELAEAKFALGGVDVTADAVRTAPEKPLLVGYDVDLIKGDSPWFRYKMPRNFAQVELKAEVKSGQLSIGIDPQARHRRYGVGIYAAAVWPLADDAEARKELGYLKAVTLTEASEADHAWIQPAFMEERHYGGSHEEFLHPEKTPGMFRALAATERETARGYVLFTRPFADPVYFDTVPTRAEADAAGRGLKFAACPGEFVPVTLSVYPLADLSGARLAASSLTSAGGAVISPDAFDLRVERYDERWVNNTHEDGTPYLRVPYYQVRRASIALEAGLSRRFVADLKVPADAKPGTYAGTLSFTAAGRPGTDAPLTVEVLPFRTTSPDVYFGAPAQFHPLYLDYGFNTLKTDLATAKEKGLKGYFVVPPGDAKAFIASIDDAFRARLAEGIEGKAPRMFVTSTRIAGHQYAAGDAETIKALQDAAPSLDILGVNDILFWMTDFKHCRPHVRLNAANFKEAEGKFPWFMDAVQPSKDLAARFTFGVWLWKSGINGRLSYADAWAPSDLSPETHGSPYPAGPGQWVIDWSISNLPLVGGSSFAFFLDDPDGRPCPSRDLINIREGITDYRYLHTLRETLGKILRSRAEGPDVQAAIDYVHKLLGEIDPDLTHYYDGWGPVDAGGENWWPKPSTGLTAERLEGIRADVQRLIADLVKDTAP